MKMRDSAICRVTRALLVGFALPAAFAGPGTAAENADDRPKNLAGEEHHRETLEALRRRSDELSR